MPRLTPCPACHAHVRTHERVCPHCDTRLASSPNRGAIALMGLTLAGCPSGSTNSPDTDGSGLAEPEYGVPDTSEEPSYDEPEYGVPDTGEAPGYGEPDYGAPDTGVAEPEYGVPESI